MFDEDSIFPPFLWAESQSSDPRTTNEPESFHRDYNSQYYMSYPNCFLIVNILLEFQEKTYLIICSIKRNVLKKTRKEDSV